MSKRTQAKFEKIFLPHLNAAYSLARWISNDRTLADDIVQTAYIRAWEYFDRFENKNSTAWLLMIVRNTAYTMLTKRNKESNLVSFDELLHHGQSDIHEKPEASQLAGVWINPQQTPEFLVEQLCNSEHISKAIQGLAKDLRETIVLREQGYSYKEIAEITEVEKGTVMSRLSRARAILAKRLSKLGNSAGAEKASSQEQS